MPKFVIERDIPGVGAKTAGDWKPGPEVVLRAVGDGPADPVAALVRHGGQVYCVYVAPSEEAVREHAKRGGFPANRVSRVSRVIDPTTAE